MANRQKFKLIDEQALRELIKTNYQQNYTILLLTYICYKHKLDTSLAAEEACEVLGLTLVELEEARKRHQIRTIGVGPGRLYGAFDLVALAAQLHCKGKISSLKDVPSFIESEPSEQV